MKFKIGDKVRILSKSVGGGLSTSNIFKEAGKERGNYWVVRIEDDTYYKGVKRYLVVDSIKDGTSGDHFLEKDLILVKNSKIPKQPKFLLQYELDEDPVEYFDNLPQVRKRLKELNKDSTFKRDSVRLFELKRELEVEIKELTSITIK